MLHSVLQVLHDALLSDHLLDLRLRLRVEGIRVEHLNLLVARRPFSPLPIVTLRPNLCELPWVVQGRRQLWSLSAQLGPEVRVTENLQADELGILLRRWSSRPAPTGTLLRRCVGAVGGNSGGPAQFPNVQGQHLPIAYLQLRQRFRVVGDKLAVVVQVLRTRLEPSLCVNGASERVNRHVWVDLERQEVLVVAMCGLGERDAQRDAPAQNASQWADNRVKLGSRLFAGDLHREYEDRLPVCK
ncbi:hypothetical protein B0T14DRAFT_217154 [Immersiella caudata]|uniref:Uncharacterized protein n=1 Tax=Immersiella caudata TaxID=314043 RepID=A0AA39WR70_9PEZI|nr:hypothetical protein B0T14DRAFT_217154 [Immersiella caudata]